MRGAPRGVSASRSEPGHAPIRAPSRIGTLRKPQQFAALAGDLATWRASRQWLAAAARLEARMGEVSEASVFETRDMVEQPASSVSSEFGLQGVRFGFTVARRQARRAVQRVMVKRLLREAARAAAAELLAALGPRRLDLVLRLRASLPDPSQMTLSQVKRELRAQADSLLAQLARRLRGSSR